MRSSPWRTRRARAGLAAGVVLAAVAAAGVTRWVVAADHRDSMLLTADPAADIADVYSFVSPTNPSNMVLAMTVNGFIPPTESATTSFDPGVLYQFKIDSDGDAVEDLVIQAMAAGQGNQQVMRFFGPRAVDMTGNRSRAQLGTPLGQVAVSHGATPIYDRNATVKLFAGVRDDPFFFDLAQFQQVIAGNATSFRNPGVDTFAGFNVLAIVVEIPIAMLGGTKLNIWGTTSR